MKKSHPPIYILEPPHSVVDLITNSSSELFVLKIPNLSISKVKQIIKRFNSLHRASREARNETVDETYGYHRGIFDVFGSFVVMKKGLLQHIEDLPKDLQRAVFTNPYASEVDGDNVYDLYGKIATIFTEEFGYTEAEYDIIESVITDAAGRASDYNSTTRGMDFNAKLAEKLLKDVEAGSILLRSSEENYTDRELFDEMFLPFKIREFMV